MMVASFAKALLNCSLMMIAADALAAMVAPSASEVRSLFMEGCGAGTGQVVGGLTEGDADTDRDGR
jgi:hypothetical protein